MEYNWWDDRTTEVSITEHPCYGCVGFDEEKEECTIGGACSDTPYKRKEE